MKKEEWVDYFQEINGRKPTPQEFTTAMKAGEFDSVTGGESGFQENRYNSVQKQQDNTQNMPNLNMKPKSFYGQSSAQGQSINIYSETINGMQQQYANGQQNIYMNNQIVPKHIQLIGPTGDVKKCSTGFSFVVYFFAWFISISRGDSSWLIRWTIYGVFNIIAISLILTNQVSGFLFILSITVASILGVIGYNRYYIAKLLKKGYVPFNQFDQMGLAILQRKGMLK